jgi:hypothetical protein
VRAFCHRSCLRLHRAQIGVQAVKAFGPELTVMLHPIGYLFKGRGFDEKAIEAVRRWRFKAAMGPNSAVPVAMPIEVTFYSRN